MPFGTIRNPLTLGASGQSDGSAYRALAESLASQQMQAGPSSGLNVLQAILGPLAQVANMNRAAEADSAYEQNRMKQYEEFQARQAEQERAAKMAETASRRGELEKLADQYQLQGPARLQFLQTGEVPSQLLEAPKQATGYDAWLAAQPPEVQAKAYQVKAGLAPRAQAPATGGQDALAIQRELEWYQTLSPEEKAQVDHLKGRDKGGTTVYDPVTGNPIYQSGGGGAELTNPVKTDLQKGILGAQESLGDLDAIGNKFASNYLTYSGRGKAAVGSFLDKAGIDNGLTQFNADRTAFVNQLNQTFNQYRKEITGAAAGEKEMERLLASMMNEEQGPEAFQAAYSQFKEAAQRNLALKQRQLQGGGLPQIAPNSGPGTPRVRRRWNPQTQDFE